MLKKSRDTKRISSLKALNNALGIFQATKPTSFMGTSTIVYVSIPDSSSTCTNLSLPTLPSGYTYQCSTTANYRKTDGTGWIPVNFNSLDIGSPISSLPIDPTNTTSTNLFFTYTTGGSWELNAILESSANKLSGDNDKTSLDGGDSYSTYEIGTDLTLAPYKDTGLVGYWKFDDASGTTAVDSSGYNNTGTLTNGPTWKTQSDCKRGGCLSFDGSDDYVMVTDSDSIEPQLIGTISLWVKVNDYSSTYWSILGKGGKIADNKGYCIWYNTPSVLYGTIRDLDIGGSAILINMGKPSINIWTFFVLTWDGSYLNLYSDGVYVSRSAQGVSFAGSNNYNLDIGRDSLYNPAGTYFNGNLDDIRIYNRALSASEIKVLYEGTK
jgi:hypothetical protein